MKNFLSILNTRAFLVAALIITGLFFLFIVHVFAPIEESAVESVEVKINGAVFAVEVAESPVGRARGLSGRDSVPEFGGMLFRFERAGIYSFWMKSTSFPIDIFWIRDGRVVYLVKNAKPPYAGVLDSDLEVFTPKSSADEVLELNAGMADRFNIKEGDVVEIAR